MHELSIAHDLVDLAAEQVLRAGAARAVSVTVRVGALSGVVAAALRSAFPAAAAGTPLEGAVLKVEEVPATIFCAACGEERVVVGVSRRCPACGGGVRDLVSGAELELTEMEVEGSAHAGG